MKARFLLAGLGLLALTGVLLLRAGEPIAPPAKGGDSGPQIKDKMSLEEQILSNRFREFEEKLLKLKQRYEHSSRQEDRDRAVILQKALDKMREASIGTRFDQMVTFIKDQARVTNLRDLKTAKERSQALADDLRAVLAMLREDSQSAKRKEELERLKEMYKEITALIKDQKRIQGQTQGGRTDRRELQQAQAQTANRTSKLAREMAKGSKGNQGGEAKNAKAGSKDAGKSEGKNAGKGKDAGKSGAQKAGQGKDAGKGGEGKQAEAKGGQGQKAGQGQQAKNGQAKDGGAPKSGAAKTAEAKAGAPKAGQAGAKSGQPKSGQQAGQAKQGGQKSGQASASKSGGQPKAGQGSPSQAKAGSKSGSKGGQGQAKASQGSPSQAQQSQSKSGGQKSQSQQAQAKGGSKSSGQGQAKQGGQQQQAQAKSDNSPQQQQQAQNDLSKAQKRVREAYENERSAEKKIEQKKDPEATGDQAEAIKNLEKARKKLEELLRQLREEEMERLLADLQARCERMLRMQIRVYEGTLAVSNAINANAGKKANRNNQQDSLKLSDDEKAIVLEASKAIQILEDEGSAVAFPEVFVQVRDDMRSVQRRLEVVDTGKITQVTEEDIIATLRDMIKALEKAKQNLQQSKSKSGGQPPPNQDQKLLDQIAELKMIRAMQIRVNNRTKLFGRQYQGEQAPADPNLRRDMHNLADRQDRIFEVTNRIVREDNR